MNKELDKVNEIQRTRAIYKADGTTVIESSLFNLLVTYAKESLQRLESIDNAEPSEALELVEELDNCLISDMSIEVDDYDESNYCMSYEYVDFNGEGLQFNDDIKEETIIDFIREKKISTIKQALLKAQEKARSEEILQKYYQEGITLDSVRALKKENAELRQKAQEPKHYLKWEDLEFNIEKQMMTVLLNGTKYTLIVGRNVHIDKLAFLRNGEINYYFLEADKQLFNDLHLERVEE